MKIKMIMGDYPPEEAERRRRPVLRSASPGTEISFTVIQGSFFNKGNSQTTALTVAPLIAEAARKAEADGFDAVVPFGTLDVGVELSRSLVRIPVVGAGQSMLHLGAQLSGRMGIVSYGDKSIPFMRKNLRAWGVYDYVGSIRAINISLVDATKEKEELRTRFLQVARCLLNEDGCELIVPMGVTMVPVQYSAADFSSELGVPVLDAVASSIQTAEMMVRMGVSHSIKSYPRTMK
jgi:allantoin racemase